MGGIYRNYLAWVDLLSFIKFEIVKSATSIIQLLQHVWHSWSAAFSDNIATDKRSIQTDIFLIFPENVCFGYLLEVPLCLIIHIIYFHREIRKKCQYFLVETKKKKKHIWS